MTQWNAPDRVRTFVILLGLVSVFSGIVGWTVQRWMPANLFVAGPWLVLWFLSPLVGLALDPSPAREAAAIPAL